MGRRKRHGRPVHGILLLDKAVGESSNQALQRVKRLFDAQKAGHTGSLDPLATGMLPICFGEATKISSYLLGGEKCYRVRARWGVRTNTMDAEGKVIAECMVPDFTPLMIEQALRQLTGTIDQIPPMFSALKHEGRRLYELARQGREVERKSRRVTIKRFDLIQWDQTEPLFEVECSSGTYVRTLIDDLGQLLGCGAMVTELRRTGVSPFYETSMWQFDQLEVVTSEERLRTLIPLDQAIGNWPSLFVSEPEVVAFWQGRSINFPNACPDDEYFRLYRDNGRFFGIGRRTDQGLIHPHRLFSF